MERSKDMFIDMREAQIASLYDSTFTKKEAVMTGKRMVDNVLENGNVDIMEFGANLVRLNEVVGSAVTEFRKHIPAEKQTVLGVEFNPVNGGNTINYEDDEIYCQLKADLNARIELLKLAQKQSFIDAYGNEVPKVSTSPRKDSVTIKF
jgi:hypothetical protein